MTKQTKPEKPRKDFPLFPHALGYWSKKINGKLRHFGRWGHTKNGKVIYDTPEGWRAAEKLYRKTAKELVAGTTDYWVVDEADVEAREKLPRGTRTMVKDIANAYLTAKHQALEAGDIQPATFLEYRNVCTVVVAYFDKGKRTAASLEPADFAAFRAALVADSNYGIVRIDKIVAYTRMMFMWAYANTKMLEEKPRFGDGFKIFKAKVHRKARRDADATVFTAAEIHKMLAAAPPYLKAMILLGINCGYGNTDCSELKQSQIDYEAMEINFPRPKTQVDRRVVLWPETAQAIREALAVRPKPASAKHEDLVFITRFGNPFVRVTRSGHGPGVALSITDAVSRQTRLLLKELGINGRRRLGFYSLRHTFATVAREVTDNDAVKLVMGHLLGDMLNAHYTHQFPRERLAAVSAAVHAWLWGEGK